MPLPPEVVLDPSAAGLKNLLTQWQQRWQQRQNLPVLLADARQNLEHWQERARQAQRWWTFWRPHRRRLADAQRRLAQLEGLAEGPLLRLRVPATDLPERFAPLRQCALALQKNQAAWHVAAEEGVVGKLLELHPVAQLPSPELHAKTPGVLWGLGHNQLLWLCPWFVAAQTRNGPMLWAWEAWEAQVKEEPFKHTRPLNDAHLLVHTRESQAPDGNGAPGPEREVWVYNLARLELRHRELSSIVYSFLFSSLPQAQEFALAWQQWKLDRASA